jgi:hypothetical protein
MKTKIMGVAPALFCFARSRWVACTAMFLIAAWSYAQPARPSLNLAEAAVDTFTVSGVVVDKNNEPWIGAVVTVKGSTMTARIGLNGNYSLRAFARDTLVFSFIGATTKEEPINRRRRIDVLLEEDPRIHDEVVVITCPCAGCPHPKTKTANP